MENTEKVLAIDKFCKHATAKNRTSVFLIKSTMRQKRGTQSHKDLVFATRGILIGLTTEGT